MAREIAYYHHEWWNGAGYPKGLAGDEIPLAARIAAVSDVYDALSTRRLYKEAFPHERCVEIIREDSGKQFDPDIVATFLQVESEFRAIADRLRNSCDDSATAIGTSQDEHQIMTPAEESLLRTTAASTENLVASQTASG